MAFKRVDSNQKVKRVKSIGVLKKATKFDGFYVKIDDDCDLILYDRKSKEYFKLLRTMAILGESEKSMFFLEVNLDSPSQVEYKGKD